MSTFDWWEFLELADNIKDIGDEASLRSSISRAYYASHGASKNYLRDKCYHGILRAHRPENHSYVIEKLRDDPDKLKNDIGNKLQRLRIKRNQADYDDVVKRIHDVSMFSLSDAKKIRANLFELLK
ncbi:MAG: hypothetical protein Q8M06_00300 [Methanobacteriaceae archaeon]|jgi:uncharacterized protein (UPF0332 family)|nr:hypothetical protein [Methanobacteriaceae archaeon]MDZ4171981.1 hypothetical protein [Methanobacteriaceae archaeon]